MAQNKIKAIPVSVIDTATVDDLAWHPINPGGLPEACFMLRIEMSTNATYLISYDGNEVHDVLFNLYPIQVNGQTNAQPNNMIANFAKGTVVYIRGDAHPGFAAVIGYYSPKDRS